MLEICAMIPIVTTSNKFNLCNNWLISWPWFESTSCILMFLILFYFIFLWRLNVPLINQYLRCVCSALRIERPKDTTNNYGGLHLHCTYNIVTDEGEKNLTPCSFDARFFLSGAVWPKEFEIRGKGVGTRLLSLFTVPLCFALNIVEETSW